MALAQASVIPPTSAGQHWGSVIVSHIRIGDAPNVFATNARRGSMVSKPARSVRTNRGTDTMVEARTAAHQVNARESVNCANKLSSPIPTITGGKTKGTTITVSTNTVNRERDRASHVASSIDGTVASATAQTETFSDKPIAVQSDGVKKAINKNSPNRA